MIDSSKTLSLPSFPSFTATFTRKRLESISLLFLFCLPFALSRRSLCRRSANLCHRSPGLGRKRAIPPIQSAETRASPFFPPPHSCSLAEDRSLGPVSLLSPQLDFQVAINPNQQFFFSFFLENVSRDFHKRHRRLPVCLPSFFSFSLLFLQFFPKLNRPRLRTRDSFVFFRDSNK